MQVLRSPSNHPRSGRCGFVPSCAFIVREVFAPQEAGSRVGWVLMAALYGLALGGWMSGAVFDLTGPYRAAFLNGIAWNLLNLSIVAWLLAHSRSPRAAPASAGDERPGAPAASSRVRSGLSRSR